MGAIHTLSEQDLIDAAAISPRKTKDINWRGKTFTVKTILPLREFLALVRRIVNDVADKDGNIMYEAVCFALRVNIIGSYAFIDLPKDVQTLYDIVLRTDLFDEIVHNIHEGQLKELVNIIYLYTGVRGDVCEPR